MISHTTAQFRRMFRELPAEVQRQAHRAYRIFRQNPNQPSLRFNWFILRGQFILFESALVIEQWESWKAMKSCGIGSARTLTMTDSFRNRGVDPNQRLETDLRPAAYGRDLPAQPSR